MTLRPTLLLHACVLAVLAVQTTTSPAFAAPRQDPARATIRGVDGDAFSGRGIDGAGLKLIEGDDTVATTISDRAGAFVFGGVEPGAYRVIAVRFGYNQFVTGPLTLAAGATVPLEMLMTPLPILLGQVYATGRVDGRAARRTEQLIIGRLLDDDTGEPIVGGRVELLEAGGRGVANTLTSEDGLFRLLSPVPGSYKLRADRIGYETAESSNLRLVLGDSIWLDFHLSAQATLLDPILVKGSAKPWFDRFTSPLMDEFYNRMSRMAQRGDFVTRDSIAAYRERGYTTSDMLLNAVMSVTGVRAGIIEMRSTTSCSGGRCNTVPCVPRYYLNGGPLALVEQLDTEFPLTTLESVEVYMRPNIPAEFSMGFPCGVIVLWSRRS